MQTLQLYRVKSVMDYTLMERIMLNKNSSFVFSDVDTDKSSKICVIGLGSSKDQIKGFQQLFARLILRYLSAAFLEISFAYQLRSNFLTTRSFIFSRYYYLSSTLCAVVTKILSNLRRISLKHQTRLAQFVSQLMTSRLLPYTVIQVLLQVRIRRTCEAYFSSYFSNLDNTISILLCLLSGNSLLSGKRIYVFEKNMN